MTYLIYIIAIIVVCRWLNKTIFTTSHIPTYDELLKTKEWKYKRNEILKRDNYRCTHCGCENNLQVHHKYYSKYPNGIKVLPWNYPNEALTTLCRNCHKNAHNKKIKTYYRRYSDNY